MAEHFKSDIKFILRTNTATTPDILVVRYHQRWEIKSIKGNGKYTIKNNLRAADNQSQNIIIDIASTSMTRSQALGRIKAELRKANKIKRLLLVAKDQKVVIVKDKS